MICSCIFHLLRILLSYFLVLVFSVIFSVVFFFFFLVAVFFFFFFFSSRRRHTRCLSDWSSDVCSSDLGDQHPGGVAALDFLLVFGLGGFGRDRFVGGFWCFSGLGWLGGISGQECRSEERRVGKEWRSGWSTGAWKEQRESNRYW